MNFLIKDALKRFYLITTWVDIDGNYIVEALHLHENGSLRTRGGSYVFSTKDDALSKCMRMIGTKKRVRGFHQVNILELPRLGHVYLKPDIDTYVSPEEMAEMVKNAAIEYYVEFECAAGLEDRFDEGVEYLALKTEEDGYYDVWDRWGEKCRCHKMRFSRLEITERAAQLIGIPDVEEL